MSGVRSGVSVEGRVVVGRRGGGDGGDGGEPSMAGTPSGRGVVKGVPAPVAVGGCVVSRARCAERGVSGDGSGDDGAGSKSAIDDVSCVVVGC